MHHVIASTLAWWLHCTLLPLLGFLPHRLINECGSLLKTAFAFLFETFMTIGITDIIQTDGVPAFVVEQVTREANLLCLKAAH